VSNAPVSIPGTWTYDDIGRVHTETLHNSETDAQTTTFNYDQPEYSYAIGRLTSVLNPDSRMEHHYNYDPYGNRQESKLSIDGFQFAVQIDYDPLQRAVLLTYPDGAKQQKQYAIDSFLSEVSVCLDDAACKAGQFTSYADFSEYTALGEPQRTAYKNGATSVTNYQYDVVGRILDYDTTSGKNTALIDQTFNWDKLDQLLSSTDKLDELRSLAYRYDGAGYLKSSAIGSRQTEYRYDAIGNLKQKGDIVFQTEGAQVLSGTRNGEEVFSAAYDSAGNMIKRHRTGSDGVKHQWRQSYDALNRMTAISSDSADAASETQVAGFTYDYNNNLVKRIDTTAGVTSYYISKNYDVSVMDDSSVVYTKYVDGINSPVAAISTGNSSLAGQLPPAPTDRWEALGSAQAGGTGAISLTTLAGLGFIFITLFAGIVSMNMPHKMDLTRVLGRHIKLGLYLLLITTVAIPRAPLAAASATLEPGVNGPGIPVAGKTLFFHSDQVRSTILVTDPDGMPQAELLYGPYGEIDESTSFGKDNFRAKFAGTELAEDIGLYLNAGRFYDPMIGRFVTADNNTIGSSTNNAVQFNRYAYAANNPITHTDPTGGSASSILFDIGLAAVAVAAVATGGGIVAVAELGAYFGGSAVNHSYDPANWNFKSWKTYGGMAAGIAVSEIGLAISIAAPEAIPEEAGAFAAFMAGVAADAAVGFAENATYAALGGASRDEILKQGLIGMATGAGFSAAGQGLSAGISRVASRSVTRAADAGEESATLGSRLGTATEKEGGGMELESMPVCSSFEAGTQVITTDGPKPIEQMELGDWVMAFDTEKGSTEPRQVTAGYRRTAARTITLTAADGTSVVATLEHPFLHEDGQWIDAVDLQPGDKLQTADAGPLTLIGVMAKDDQTQVYNIEVEGLHTYLISTNGWIVHNPNHGCTSKNAAELRKNMQSQGRSEPNFSNSAHHIVESTDSSPYMVKARQHLDDMKIDINRSTNGIYLARSSAVQKTIGNGKWRKAYPHSRVHTKAYKKYVWNSIKHTKTRRETLRELRVIKRQLRKGKLPPGTVNWP
jgi:RHS repeat-associated protein